MYRMLIVLCFFLSGCTTSKLWEDESARVLNVNGFYVNGDTNDLIVTTRREAYLFRAQQQLGQALMLSREVEFTPAFDDFLLTRSNKIVGDITLTLQEKDPSAELINQLTVLGFTRESAADSYQLQYRVNGERYIIDGELPFEKLENEYPVRMTVPRGPLDTAGRVIATPFTLTFDTAASALSIVVLVPSLTMLAITQGLFGP